MHIENLQYFTMLFASTLVVLDKISWCHGASRLRVGEGLTMKPFEASLLT